MKVVHPPDITELKSEYIFKQRKMPPQNIIIRLKNRETFCYMKPGTHFHTSRQFYQSIFPNFNVINVEKPPCFLRKFSPDGRYFIAFSSDQTSLEIYIYKGPAAAADLFQFNDDIPKSAKRSQISQDIFDRMFKLKYSVHVTQGLEELNRECSLFSEDGHYVIIGSASFIPEEIRPHFYEIYTNNESMTPNHRSSLENYTLHLVDIRLGKLCDTRQFKVDKIFLSHNQGLYLYKDILAVLSVQHQSIHIYQILDGMFVDVRTIGRFCFEDDSYFYNLVYPTERAFRDVSINCLKHRMLSFLYRRALMISQRDNSPLEVRKFFHHFSNYNALKLWKMQLLDEDHLLLKYASEDVVTLKCTETNTQPSFFMVYNMKDGKVLAIFENTSSDLVKLFENFTDSFRNASINCETQFTCNPSNNIHARVLQQRFKQTIISAKYGGETEATIRLLAQLPISAQSYSSSPYLDLSLFSYDDKWVSVMERPKTCAEYPIRFYGRGSGFLKFQIFAGGLNLFYTSGRRLVAFTFHPTDPFAISVQRTNSNYVVNFHVRQDPAFGNNNFFDDPTVPLSS